MTLRIAWFATAKGTSSRLLFQRAQEAIDRGDLDARIAVVFCNRDRGQSANTDAFLTTVEESSVPLVTLSSGAFRKRIKGRLSQPGETLASWRRDFDLTVRERITPYEPDIGVLAGYMLIATDALCDWLPLLNLHPAEPGGPIGTWQEVIRELVESGARTSGLMLQRATTALDRGPIVTSCRYAIRGATFDALWRERSGPVSEEDALFQAIRAEGVKREPPFIMASLEAIADGRIAMPASTDGGPNVDLTTAVEAAVARDPG